MGNLVSCGLGHVPSKHVVKVVHSNGLVDEFHRPITVRELTVDYPDHCIYHSNDLYLMQTIAPLSDDEEMELGQIYFLLPPKTFDGPLTEEDVAALLSKASVARKASYKGLYAKQMPPLPLPPQPTVELKQNGDTTQVTVSREFLQRLLAEARMKFEDTRSQANICDSQALQTAYMKCMLEKSMRSWRPRLETIEEGNFAVV